MIRALGVLLALGLALPGIAQDRREKAYELMYEDVQLLKVQIQRIEKRLDQSADDLKTLGGLVRDLGSQFKTFQSSLARNQEGMRDVPSQVRALMELLTQVENQILRLSEDVRSLKGQAVGDPALPVAVPEGKPPVDPAAKEAVPTPPATASAQETYQAALADYEQGHFDLAADGFSLYREQFPASPLADDALYMIGECLYSQRKFPQAVEALDELILNHPLSNKIAAAYYKKGFALAEMKRTPDAIAVLRLLISKYPLEEEARQAQQKIKELQDIK